MQGRRGHPAFKHGVDEKFLARGLSHYKPKIMHEIMEMKTVFCSGDDTWLAKKKDQGNNPKMFEVKDGNGRSRRNHRNKHQGGSNVEVGEVNAEFNNQGRSGKKKTLQGRKGGRGPLSGQDPGLALCYPPRNDRPARHPH